MSNPLGSSADSGRVRGWIVELIESETALWGIHPDLLSHGEEVALRLMAAFLQSWFDAIECEWSALNQYTYLDLHIYAEVQRVSGLTLPQKR